MGISGLISICVRFFSALLFPPYVLGDFPCPVHTFPLGFVNI